MQRGQVEASDASQHAKRKVSVIISSSLYPGGALSLLLSTQIESWKGEGSSVEEQSS